jgi:hypothetical protein
MTHLKIQSDRTAVALIEGIGLRSEGPMTWGRAVPCPVPGVYVIETQAFVQDAPLDLEAIAVWIDRVSTLRLDGRRPSAPELARRIGQFWMSDDRVVYVGRAGGNVGQRVRQFYQTPLGDRRPHAGGHWLKTLANLQDLNVWWARTSDPNGGEAALLAAYAARHGGGLVLPFANRQSADGVRKNHGITGSTLLGGHSRSLIANRVPETPPLHRPPPGGSTRIDRINAALQEVACARPEREIRAVDAAAALDRMGLLRDSDSRPGKPLRDLLRDGVIRNAYQDGGRWWYIRCESPGE